MVDVINIRRSDTRLIQIFRARLTNLSTIRDADDGITRTRRLLKIRTKTRFSSPSSPCSVGHRATRPDRGYRRAPCSDPCCTHVAHELMPGPNLTQSRVVSHTVAARYTQRSADHATNGTMLSNRYRAEAKSFHATQYRPRQVLRRLSRFKHAETMSTVEVCAEIGCIGKRYTVRRLNFAVREANRNLTDRFPNTIICYYKLSCASIAKKLNGLKRQKTCDFVRQNSFPT